MFVDENIPTLPQPDSHLNVPPSEFLRLSDDNLLNILCFCRVEDVLQLEQVSCTRPRPRHLVLQAF